MQTKMSLNIIFKDTPKISTIAENFCFHSVIYLQNDTIIIA